MRYYFNAYLFLFIVVQLSLALKNECCSKKIKRFAQSKMVNQTIGYVLSSDKQIWSTFHWDKLTMLSLIDFNNPSDLISLAHRHNVLVMLFANFTLSDIFNADNWIEKTFKTIEKHNFDGINIFVDDPVEANSAASKNVTNFIRLVTDKFRQHFPGSLVLFNVPFSPYNEKKMAVDGKNYDYVAISKLVDLVVIMNFDQRSQSFDYPNCVAGAQESLYVTTGAIMAYEKLGLDLSKMILTMGMYVDQYTCTNYMQNYLCFVKPYEYRGAKCSSRIAKRIPWNVYNQINKTTWLKVWDEHSNHDIRTTLETDHGWIQQYWEEHQALWKRLRLVKQKKLVGIGAWVLNYLDEKLWNEFPIRIKSVEFY